MFVLFSLTISIYAMLRQMTTKRVIASLSITAVVRLKICVQISIYFSSISITSKWLEKKQSQERKVHQSGQRVYRHHHYSTNDMS